jgi:hypothetical protein
VDPAQGTVSGYYREIDEPPNMARSECAFYFSGKLQGDRYAIQAWQPDDRKSKATSGQLTVFSADKGRPSALLKLKRLSRDCSALNPKLDQAEGALLDKSKNGAWIEVRVVKNSKSFYYQTPDLASPQRSSARRGSVLTVTARQSGWAQIQADQKVKGWIQEADLYPLNPEETLSETAKPASPVAAAAPQVAPPTASAPAPQPDSKNVFLQRLKTLDAEAFDMALRVLANPAERNALSSKRSTLEQNLNAIVEGLNEVDPSAYRSDAERIYEAFLDLQYAKQDQPVVSLRLHREIQKKLRPIIR